MDLRMGLGTDQMELPEGLAQEVTAMPPVPGADVPRATVHLPDGDERADLAPWAGRMQLPGIDA